MKRAFIFICIAAMLVCAGCGRTTGAETTRPWAVTEGKTAPSTVTHETTEEAELSTMEALTCVDAEGGAAITLPQGVRAEDIETLESVLLFSFYAHDFDCETAGEYDPLYYISNGIPWGIHLIYPRLAPNAEFGAVERLYVSDTPDPLSRFDDEYLRVPASAVNFLVRDFLNCAPDPRWNTEYVYTDSGYYYFSTFATGEDTSTVIRACQTLSNGHYRITAELTDPGGGHCASAFVEAAIIETEGVRHWTIYRVETFE